MNCTETKNSMMVGRRERLTKATTNLVLSLAPIMFFRRSKSSFTRLRTVKNNRSSKRITLRFMRPKMRILFENGKLSPRSNTLDPK